MKNLALGYPFIAFRRLSPTPTFGSILASLPSQLLTKERSLWLDIEKLSKKLGGRLGSAIGLKPTRSSNTSSETHAKERLIMTKRAPSRRTKARDIEEQITTEQPVLPGLPAVIAKTPPIFLGSTNSSSPEETRQDNSPMTELPPKQAQEVPTGPALLKKLLDDSVARARVVDIEKKFRVTLARDHNLIYPDLYLSVFIAGSKYEEAQFAEMFARAACQKALSVGDADLVVFTGGVDVDPQLYGAKPHKTTYTNPARDTLDIGVYQQCLDQGIPMFGVCRGAQFLHVMNGGKLYQDVDNHNGDHAMFDVVAMKQIERVSSVHHQMCIENVDGGMQILGTSSVARNRWKDPQICVKGPKADVEAFFYRDTCCFGVQGHPEYRGYNFFAKWCLDHLNDFVILNPDVEWKNTRRRLRQDVIDFREKVISIPAIKAN